MRNDGAMAATAAETERVPRVPDDFAPEAARKPGEAVFAFLAMTVGALGWYFAMDMTSDTYSSPSVFPKAASAVIAVCGLAILIRTLRREAPPAGSSAFAFLFPRDVLAMLLLLLAYCAVLPFIHFIPASYLFMAAGMIFLRRGGRIARSLAYSAAALAALVLLFRCLFLVILP